MEYERKFENDSGLLYQPHHIPLTVKRFMQFNFLPFPCAFGPEHSEGADIGAEILLTHKLQGIDWRTFCMIFMRLFEITCSLNILVPQGSEQNQMI